MNLDVIDVVITSADGQKFYRTGKAFIRGNSIKTMRMEPKVLEKHLTN